MATLSNMVRERAHWEGGLQTEREKRMREMFQARGQGKCKGPGEGKGLERTQEQKGGLCGQGKVGKEEQGLGWRQRKGPEADRVRHCSFQYGNSSPCSSCLHVMRLRLESFFWALSVPHPLTLP